MKIAIVSDLHLGDSQCALVDKDTRKLTNLYDKFRDAVGTENDFLVMAGDILDFSVSKYKDTYECARTFFKQIKADGVANEVIYLPGNHDSNVWHTVEHQTNIINRMAPGKSVQDFRHSVPAILDDRMKDPWDKLTLHGVWPQEKGSGAKYGGLYLDQLVDGKPFFNVAHPNLYLVTNKGCTLVTHGHYFQQYWTLTSWLALKVARQDLNVGALDVSELVGINFPLVQLACTGVGQSGPLSKVVDAVQKDVKKGDLKLVRKYLGNLKKVADDYWDFEKFKGRFEFLNVKEKLSDKLLDFIEGVITEKVEKIAEEENCDARYNSTFCYEEGVQGRMGEFYRASLVELDSIQGDAGIPAPERIIFGHTHIPGPWKNDEKEPILPLEHTGGKVVGLLNCGGWLRDDKGVFTGANVFSYDSASQDILPKMVE